MGNGADGCPPLMFVYALAWISSASRRLGTSESSRTSADRLSIRAPGPYRSITAAVSSGYGNRLSMWVPSAVTRPA